MEPGCWAAAAGPNTLRNLERSLAVIGKLGLDIETAMNVLGTLATSQMAGPGGRLTGKAATG